MKPRTSSHRLFFFVIAIALCSLTCLAAAQTAPTRSPKGPGKIVVRPKFGGQIAGYDIDQNGTEGVLSEQATLKNGDTLSAVETFDQKTGKIVKVIRKGVTQYDDDIVIGIVGTSTAIVVHEHAVAHGAVRTYHLISPLDANKYTGLWHPPHFDDNNDIVFGVSHDQGATDAAFFVLHDIYPGTTYFAFEEDMQKQTFGKEITMTSPDFEPFTPVAFAFDVKTNTGVLAAAQGCNYCTPEIGSVNLNTGKFDEFQGLGKGLQGFAVDSDDGVACTTSADDASVQFYDLKTQTGISEDLPGGEGQAQSGFRCRVRSHPQAVPYLPTRWSRRAQLHPGLRSQGNPRGLDRFRPVQPLRWLHRTAAKATQRIPGRRSRPTVLHLLAFSWRAQRSRPGQTLCRSISNLPRKLAQSSRSNSVGNPATRMRLAGIRGLSHFSIPR